MESPSSILDQQFLLNRKYLQQLLSQWTDDSQANLVRVWEAKIRKESISKSHRNSLLSSLVRAVENNDLEAWNSATSLKPEKVYLLGSDGSESRVKRIYRNPTFSAKKSISWLRQSRKSRPGSEISTEVGDVSRNLETFKRKCKRAIKNLQRSVDGHEAKVSQIEQVLGGSHVRLQSQTEKIQELISRMEALVRSE